MRNLHNMRSSGCKHKYLFLFGNIRTTQLLLSLPQTTFFPEVEQTWPPERSGSENQERKSESEKRPGAIRNLEEWMPPNYAFFGSEELADSSVCLCVCALRRLYGVLIMPTRHTFRWGAGHRCTDFLSRKRVVRPAKLIFLETSTAGKAFPNNKLSLVRLAYKGEEGGYCKRGENSRRNPPPPHTGMSSDQWMRL